MILTTFEIDDYVFEALRAGASGFLVKDTEPVDLIAAVRLVAAGEALLSPSVTRRVIEEFAVRAHVSRAMVKLGARDRAQLVVLACEYGLVRPSWVDAR
jgi:DNA-binding NarL/FixJ family response regulator